MKQKGSKKNSRTMLLLIGLVILAAVGGSLLFGRSRETDSLTEKLSALRADRTVTGEEYRFLAGIAEKQGRGDSEQEIRDFIEKINAEFYLGSKLGLCEPFDYAAFQYRAKAENEDRAMKKLNGQVFYGPESLSEESYFEYSYSQLRSDLATWLVDHRDREMIDAARSFYDSNTEGFTEIRSVTYKVTVDGMTETKTIEDTMFRTMGQSDPGLMDFLAQAEDGEEKLLTDGSGRLVKKLGITTELPSFQSQERFAVEVWIFRELLDQLAASIAENTVLTLPSEMTGSTAG